ncbi:MAG: TRAP transporter substrate-binding protein [Candidatus Latescibacterota bacterium]
MTAPGWVGAALLALPVAGAAQTAPPAPAEGEPIALTYSILFPATHRHTVLASEWAQEIAARTGGRVQITLYPGGTLTPPEECYEGVEKGTSDIGMSALAYARDRFPLSAVIDLPLGYPSGAVATELANAFLARFAPREFAGVKILYLHAHGPGFLHTQVPVTALEELQGMRILCAGLPARIVAALGGTPVTVPMDQTYEAQSAGLVDGSMAPMEALPAWPWGQAVRSSTQAYGSSYTTAFFVAMNQARWESLPKDVRQIIAAVDEEWTRRTGQEWDELDQAARDWVGARGNTLITLSENEDARWVRAVQPVLDEYLANTAARGLPGGDAVRFCQIFLAERR